MTIDGFITVSLWDFDILNERKGDPKKGESWSAGEITRPIPDNGGIHLRYVRKLSIRWSNWTDGIALSSGNIFQPSLRRKILQLEIEIFTTYLFNIGGE